MYFDSDKVKDIKTKFEDISDLDANIIYLKEDKWTYSQIQLILGNPSKRYIRSVLVKYAPQLLIN
jgi:hypothetical protein